MEITLYEILRGSRLVIRITFIRDVRGENRALGFLHFFVGLTYRKASEGEKEPGSPVCLRTYIVRS